MEAREGRAGHRRAEDRAPAVDDLHRFVGVQAVHPAHLTGLDVGHLRGDLTCRRLGLEPGVVGEPGPQGEDDGRDDARDDDRGDDGDDARTLAEAKVSATEAVDAALASVSNGKVESVELEEEDGRAFWETDVLGADGTWYEVRVDAHTGDVLQKQAGDDDGRDDD